MGITKSQRVRRAARWAGAGLLVASPFAAGVARAEPPSVQVTAAYNDTCVRKVDATAWCWGFDGIGELGDGTQNNSSVPVAVINVGAGVAEVSAGQYHTCARKTDGTAWCWGYDLDGEVGDGSMNGSSPPVQVATLGTAVAQISTGYLHTCARKTDGTLWCWGRNDSGQLGDGSTNSQATPVQVAPLGGAVAEVSAGVDHTCARKSDGSVWCWGGNSLGQLGDGTTMDRPSPGLVSGLGSAALEVSANDQFACARLVDGSVWCWGGNPDGELGVGDQVSSSSPRQVTTLGNSTVQLSAGDNGACAVLGDHSLWCWGANFKGNVGDGTVMGRLAPVPVTALGHSVVEVSMGVHTCARTTNGNVWCWGYNVNGQLGDSTTTDRSLPVLVPIATAATVLPVPAIGPRAAMLLALLLVLGGLWARGAKAKRSFPGIG